MPRNVIVIQVGIGIKQLRVQHVQVGNHAEQQFVGPLLMGGGGDLHVEAPGRRQAANEQRRRLHVAGHRWARRVRLTRTVKSLRRCAIRLRPISAVGNDCKARRVVSTALAARTTTAPGASDRNRRWPPASTSTLCTVPPAACSLTTWASGHQEQSSGGVVSS